MILTLYTANVRLPYVGWTGRDNFSTRKRR